MVVVVVDTPVKETVVMAVSVKVRASVMLIAARLWHYCYSCTPRLLYAEPSTRMRG
jgi:hypothetical protein